MSQSNGIGPREPKHGTASEYKNHGCRCKACTAAASSYKSPNGKSPAKTVCDCGQELPHPGRCWQPVPESQRPSYTRLGFFPSSPSE